MISQEMARLFWAFWTTYMIASAAEMQTNRLVILIFPFERQN